MTNKYDNIGCLYNMGAHFTKLNIIAASMTNHIQYKVLGEITYPFPNFYGASLGMDK